jgi:hypothetical protein
MSDAQQDLIEVLERAVDRAKPQGTELTFHSIAGDQAGSGSFTTIHVVTSDGLPVDDAFDFQAVARELGEQARAKVEDRRVYSQQPPLPYKVITGLAGEMPFEIVFLLNERA